MNNLPVVRSPWRIVILVLGFTFLYAPMLMLVIYSFNSSKLVTVWAGWSTRWYGELFRDDAMMSAVGLSLTIAACAATMASILGTIAAMVMVRFGRFRGSNGFAFMITAPLVMPDVITGLSLLLLFVALAHAIGWPADRGMLTITRWVFDGLRLVSLAQAACESRGCSAADHMAIVQQDRVATFLFKKTPFTPDDVEQLRRTSANLGFTVLYAPGQRDATNDYAKLALAPDRFAFYASYHHDVAPTTDNRPFFFHTTKIKDQFQTAFGRSMLFGNGLSALMTLMAISAAFVTLFVVGPLLVSGSELRGSQWPLWLGYFGMLGAGFMLIEVALLQRFVLLLGHPVYSLTVTLFSVLLGTGIGSLISRRVSDASLLRTLQLVLLGIVGVAFLAIFALPPIVGL